MPNPFADIINALHQGIVGAHALDADVVVHVETTTCNRNGCGDLVRLADVSDEGLCPDCVDDLDRDAASGYDDGDVCGGCYQGMAQCTCPRAVCESPLSASHADAQAVAQEVAPVAIEPRTPVELLVSILVEPMNLVDLGIALKKHGLTARLISPMTIDAIGQGLVLAGESNYELTPRGRALAIERRWLIPAPAITDVADRGITTDNTPTPTEKTMTTTDTPALNCSDILNGKATDVAKRIKDRATGIDTFEACADLRRDERDGKARVTVLRAIDEVEQQMRDDDDALTDDDDNVPGDFDDSAPLLGVTVDDDDDLDFSMGIDDIENNDARPSLAEVARAEEPIEIVAEEPVAEEPVDVPPTLAEVKGRAQELLALPCGSEVNPVVPMAFVQCSQALALAVLALPDAPAKAPRAPRAPRTIEGGVLIESLTCGDWFRFAGSERLCLAARQTGTRLRFSQQRNDGPRVWAMSNRTNGCMVLPAEQPDDTAIFAAAVEATGSGSVGRSVRDALGLTEDAPAA